MTHEEMMQEIASLREIVAATQVAIHRLATSVAQVKEDADRAEANDAVAMQELHDRLDTVEARANFAAYHSV